MKGATFKRTVEIQMLLRCVRRGQRGARRWRIEVEVDV